MRTLKYLGAAAAVLLLAALALGWLLLRASLPRLDGALAASGLTGAVRITRDSRGVPTIEATDRADLAYASGFVHAQDRYFRSEEHTSELQSQSNLVCRLLLEKKKKYRDQSYD